MTSWLRQRWITDTLCAWAHAPFADSERGISAVQDNGAILKARGDGHHHLVARLRAVETLPGLHHVLDQRLVSARRNVPEVRCEASNVPKHSYMERVSIHLIFRLAGLASSSPKLAARCRSPATRRGGSSAAHPHPHTRYQQNTLSRRAPLCASSRRPCPSPQ